ncbi:MAG: hypothetical protein JXR41_05605 [Bacteroidales bacterium]|nr:hypothetical protein [Bacteroidales bacterium]
MKIIIKTGALQVITIAAIIVAFTTSCQNEKASPRNVVLINDNWEFCIDSLQVGLKEGWSEKGLPDSITAHVNVPHTWNINPKTSEYMGSAWYEKIIDIQGNDTKLYLLRFGAIYHDAVIWVNGAKAGEHKGSGYTSFNVDISPYIRLDKPNRIMVRVDNSFSRENLPYLNYFDWPMDGGIYRDVKLIATGRPAIEYMLIDPQFDIEDLTRPARVNVRTKFFEQSLQQGEKVQIKINVTEENQPTSNTVASLIREITLDGATVNIDFEIEDFKVWHFDAPNLYRMTVNVINADGETTDSYASNFGFREFKTGNNKIIFNGEVVRLMGAEYMAGGDPDFGMAVTTRKLADDLKKLKEANCVFTRVHWQQSEELLDWFDRNGILLQEEIPLWQRPSVFNDTLWNVARLQIREMVTRDYNHPCIVGWGVGNEVWEVPDSVNVLVQQLRKEYMKWDTTRMLNYVSNTIHKRFDKDASAFSDVLMPNDYSGLWHLIPSEGGITEDMVPGLLEKYHRLMPEKPIIISEYGYPEPAFKGGDPARIKHMIRHTGYYADSPYVSGAIYFCLNDYRTHMGEGGTGVMKHRLHGVLDFKGNKKPSYKVLQNLSSPVAISKIEYPGAGKISVTITGKHFPAYTVKNYKLIAQSDNKEVSAIIPDIKPGEKVKLDFEAPGTTGKLRIVRPGGFEVIDTVFNCQ